MSGAAPALPTRLAFRQALLHALWWGALTGYGELAYAAFRRHYRGLFLFQSPDIIWMTPAADAAVFAAVVALLYLICAGRAQQPNVNLVTGTAVALSALSLLLLFPPLHQGAALLLAVGAGVQAARSGLALRPWYGRLIRRGAVALGATVVLTLAVQQLVRSRAEARAAAGLPAARPGAPNVLLIVLDTVRALSMSLYGYDRPTTPGLARWAESGVRFEMALATAPWTLPSHGSMMTGREAHELSTNWFTPLDATFPTLAERLGSAGYLTGGFIANTPYTSREVGLGRGFVHYEDYPRSAGQFAVSASLVRALASNSHLRQLINNHELVSRKRAPDINQAFLRWVDRRGDRPFFAFLNYYDAHTPYLPPEPFASRFLPPGVPGLPDLPRRTSLDSAWDPTRIAGAMGAYDGAIAYLDQEVSRLLAELDRRGLLHNTLVILTSDHGEEFAEHGLVHHGNSLYRASLHVPLILGFGDRVPAATRVTTPVSIRDIPATVLDLTGIGGPFPGRSLARFWTAPETAEADPVFSEVRYAALLPEWYPSSKGDMISVLHQGLRYIRNGDGTVEVYDLSRDGPELINLAADSSQAPTIARLGGLVDRATAARP